jgi:HSP20 family protein
MAEVKEAPRPKTENGPGPSKDIAPRATAAPMKSNASPFAYMRRFAEEMEREAGFIPGEWSPQIDVLEREGQFAVRADLPGLSKEDVKVDVTDDLLTIQGERKQQKKEEREGYCYSECSYGSFYRAIPLPAGAEASKATAQFHNGVLEIAMPAPTQGGKKARRLEVREGK